MTKEPNPYPHEHAARIHSPSRYARMRRRNDYFGRGRHVIFGITKGGKTEVQAIRFSSVRYTIEDAKKWLDKHGYKPVKLEHALRQAQCTTTSKERGHRMAKAIPANISKRFSWQSPDGRKKGTFRVNPGTPLKFAYKEGAKRFSTRANPESWSSEGPTYSATLFVGFSVGNKPTWNMNDLVKLVKRVRVKQVGHPDSSFLYQKGIYTHESNGMVVTEDGAQCIVLNVPPMVRKLSVFRKNMIALAETVCRDMKQETVIVRLDKNGIAQETIGVIS